MKQTKSGDDKRKIDLEKKRMTEAKDQSEGLSEEILSCLDLSNVFSQTSEMSSLTKEAYSTGPLSFISSSPL